MSLNQSEVESRMTERSAIIISTLLVLYDNPYDTPVKANVRRFAQRGRAHPVASKVGDAFRVPLLLHPNHLTVTAMSARIVPQMNIKYNLVSGLHNTSAANLPYVSRPPSRDPPPGDRLPGANRFAPLASLGRT
eukprot:8973251-Pyramimonas_sp.AAC.1